MPVPCAVSGHGCRCVRAVISCRPSVWRGECNNISLSLQHRLVIPGLRSIGQKAVQKDIRLHLVVARRAYLPFLPTEKKQKPPEVPTIILK